MPEDDIAAGLGEVTGAWTGEAPAGEPEQPEAYPDDPEWVDEPIWQDEGPAQPQGWENDPYEAQAVLAEQQERAQDVQQAHDHLSQEAGVDYALEATRQALAQQGLRDVDPEQVAIEANQQLQEIGIGLMNDGYSSDEALQVMREHGIPQAVLEAQAGAAKTWARYDQLETEFLRAFPNAQNNRRST